MGMAVGALVALTVTYADGGLGARTFTVTRTFTTISLFTVYVPSTALYAQITTTVTACQWSGSLEYCQVVVSNTGSLGTATTGQCVLNYGSHAYAGYSGPTLASAVSPGSPQQLLPGGSATVYCQASGGVAAGAGAQLTGTLTLSDGGEAIFSVNATS
jgi:hypothetical protein